MYGFAPSSARMFGPAFGLPAQPSVTGVWPAIPPASRVRVVAAPEQINPPGTMAWSL